jgi:NADH-quinone oxidoreductase subunit C
MTPATIVEILKQSESGSIVSATPDGLHPHVVVAAEHLPALAAVLKTDARLRFDLLRCLSAVDWPAKSSIELSYDLMSTALGHAFAVKVVLDRTNPQIESVGDLWPAARWHEREAFDLLGVTFLHHPDLSRILMPEDWIGHPLRKDYPYPAEYKGLKLNP